MDICIESLYSIGGSQAEKRRTLDTIRVLKGAVNVSKSKTGEVMYRHNKYDKNALKRQLKEYDRNAERTRVDSESLKRNVLRNWSLVFERKKSICDSLRKFEDLLDTALDSQTNNKDVDEDDFQVLMLNEKDNSKDRRLNLESHTSSKCMENGVGHSTCHSRTPKLPLTSSGFLVQTGIYEKVPEKEKSTIEKPYDVFNYDPKFEKSSMKGFLEDQKKVQEQLLTRNSLNKLKNSLEKEHSFYKLRMKCRLPDDPAELLEKVQHHRLLSRRASADRFLLSHKRGQGHANNQRELTRRSSMFQMPWPSRCSNDLDLARSKTFHL